MKIECLPHLDHCIFSSNLSVLKTFKAAIAVQIKRPQFLSVKDISRHLWKYYKKNGKKKGTILPEEYNQIF